MEIHSIEGRKLPPPPKRHSKSRSGCQFCKQRRIKCDENSPCCNQCLKRGLSCPGYQRPMKWRHIDGTGQPRQQSKGKKNCNSVMGQVLYPSESIQNLEVDPSNSQSTTPNFPRLPINSQVESCDRDDTMPSDALRDINDVGGTFSSTEVGDILGPESLNDLGIADIWGFSGSVSNLVLQSPEFNSEVFMSPHESIDEELTLLKNHYFSVVCRLNSCFDSALNPFRSVIADLMTSSPLVYYVVLMVSASHICHKRKELSSAVQKYRKQAISCLVQDKTVTGGGRFGTILGNVLLGMTSGWQNPSSLGISHIHSAREFFQLYLNEPTGSHDPRSTAFLTGIMAYWEATTSILGVTGNLDSLDYLSQFIDQEIRDIIIQPHPWTGASTTLFIYASQAFTLCRQSRSIDSVYASVFPSDMQHIIHSENLKKAEEIENKVLRYSAPFPGRIEDPRDEFTTVEHFGTLAQIYRSTILLQLYLTFPELLREPEISEYVLDLGYTGNSSKKSYKETVIGLAVGILNLVSSVPKLSGIRVLITLPLIIAGSALQNTQSDEDFDDTQQTKLSRARSEILSLQCSGSMISHWRSFIRHQLKALHDFIGLEPLLRALQILDTVWLRSDLCLVKQTDKGNPVFIHWLDVMVEERLESVFG